MAIKNFLYVDANGDYTEGLANGNFVKRTCAVSAAVNDLVVESETEANGVDVVSDNNSTRSIIGVIVEKPDALNAIILNKGTISVTSVTKAQNVFLSTTGKITDTMPEYGYLHLLGTAVENNLVDFDPVNTKVLLYEEPSGGIDQYTSLMIHSDTFDGDSVFKDSSSYMRTLAVSGAKHKTVKAKFGTSSMFFDGTNDFVEATQATELDFGTGEFTVDFWAYTLGNSGYAVFFGNYKVDTCLTFHQSDNSGAASVGTIDAGQSTSAGKINFTIPINTWFHAAIIRISNTLYAYINGTFAGSITTNLNFTSNEGWRLGCMTYQGSENYFWNGYIDEFRISKGIARWDNDFIPPDRPYTT